MGGSGGGSSGKVDYPDYMKEWHHDLLDFGHTGPAVAIGTSITEVINSAIGSSPWSGAVTYDPDADITAMEAALTGFDALIAGIAPTTNWAALFAQAALSIAIADRTVANMAAVADETVANITGGLTEAQIVASVAAMSNNLDDEVTNKITPRFQGGMRNINAVVSSAYVIGLALIEGFRLRDVANYEASLRITGANLDADVSKVNMDKDLKLAIANMDKDVRISSGNMEKDVAVATFNIKKDMALQGLLNEAAGQMLQIFLNSYNWEESYLKYVLEQKRIKMIAKHEEASANLELDGLDAKWDLEVFTYGGNLLASIGSASVQTGQKGPSQMQSAMGGAMAGAATGYMVSGGNPTGAVIGGAIGFASAFM